MNPAKKLCLFAARAYRSCHGPLAIGASGKSTAKATELTTDDSGWNDFGACRMGGSALGQACDGGAIGVGWSIARRWFGAAVAASLMALTACGGDAGGGVPGQHYADVAAQIPPPAPGFGRIYFYRIYDPYGGSAAFMPIDVNGTQAAMSQPGTVSYMDFPANTYRVTVNTPGLYPSQNTNVYLAAGQTVYILAQYNSAFSQGFTAGSPFLLSIVDPAQGLTQIQPLAYSASP